MSGGPFANLEARVVDEARRRTGLEDMGDPAYREGLAVLAEALAQDRRVAAVSDAVAAKLADIMTTRLYSQHGWNARPEVLESEIGRPVVIVGIPRTGTTMLHKLLSMDQRFQVLENWISWAPQVRPPRNAWPELPAYRDAIERQAAKPADVKAVHFVEADEADECLRLMAQDYVSNLFGSRWPIPVYDEWFRARDERSTYLRYANNLRLIGADDPERTWLLKNPSSVLGLEALLATFPDARVIQTHRDPLQAIPSLCGVLAVHRAANGVEYDPVEIGRRELALWSEAARDSMALHDHRPQSFVDIHYADLVRDPIAVVRETYAALAIELTPSCESAMESWLEANPQGKHGTHRYRGEDFGLDPNAIRERFAEYRAWCRFDEDRR